jgi:peptide deformylase
MASLFVLVYPDDRLRIKATPVLQFNEALQQEIKDLFETMYEDHGVGLAATQVNIHKRIFVMDCSEGQNAPLCFVNPEIVYSEGEVQSEEGCLSFPGVYAKVPRASKIRVSFLSESGEPQEREFEGLECMCVQHEIDHLNGVTFVDHLSNLKRIRLLKKLQKQQRQTL